MAEKETRGLSVKALRFIYLGIAALCVVLSIVLLSMRVSKPMTLFGFETKLSDFHLYEDFIATLKAGFKFDDKSIDLRGLVSAVFGVVFVASITVYEVVITIIALVYFIILLISTIVYGVKNKDEKETEGKFHALERKFAKILTLFLIFDCFIVVCGGKPTSSFVIEIILVSLLFVGNSVSNILRKELAPGHKFDVQGFIYSVVEMVIVGLTILAIFLGLTKEHFFNAFFNELVNLIINLTQKVKPGKEVFIFFGATVIKTVGFFLALSMIKRVLSYYPYNDQPGALDVPATNSLLGKSIACIILYALAGILIKSAGYYTSIAEVLKSGVLVLIGVLGMSISLRIAQKANSPKKEEEEPAKEVAEKPEEEPAK